MTAVPPGMIPYPYALPFYPPFPAREPVFGAQSPAPPDSPSPASKNPTIYPAIRDWLCELDEGPRGSDGHNFVQYAENFEKEQIIRISEIADSNMFTRTDLMSICPGMKLGTANVLLQYARDDVKTIQRAKGIRYKTPGQTY